MDRNSKAHADHLLPSTTPCVVSERFQKLPANTDMMSVVLMVVVGPVVSTSAAKADGDSVEVVLVRKVAVLFVVGAADW